MKDEAIVMKGLTEEEYQTTLALRRYLDERHTIDPGSEIVGGGRSEAANKCGCPGSAF